MELINSSKTPLNNPHSNTAKDVNMQQNDKFINADGNDTLPWYKQFWPWFIFGLPGVVVIAALATVYLAVYNADSMVSDQYYKEGLAINAVVADLNHAKAMDLSAEINVDISIWQVQLSANTTMNDDHLIVELHHPADSDKDLQFTLFNAGNQIYRGTLSDVEMNRWYIDISPHGKEGTDANWRLKGEIDLSNKTTRLKNH
ncbi:MAG: FixH family protein [Pseudomonadales bacterium]|nr:FixH family protein [Pseudomonadales bacterium]